MMISEHSQNATQSAERIGVAHLAFSLRTGGMERLLVEYAQRAERQRFDLSFFSLTCGGRPADDIEASGLPVHCLNKRPGFRWTTVWQLVRLFRRAHIQVVHTHNSGAMIYGVLAARLARVPAVIHTRHGQRFGASRMQNLSFTSVSRLVDRVVGVSKDGAQQCLREGVPADRVRTIWNGIDLARFAYSGSKRGGPAVLVARLVPEKNLPLLLESVARTIRREPSFRLQVVGDGPCLQDARIATRKLGLTQHVELLGERSDIPEILRNASLFVLPSLTEGISLTLLEAMACGLPVVATRVGGNGEVVEDGKTGLLVPSDDAEELSRAIQRLWKDPDEARRFGEAGRRRVERHFDVNRMVTQYEDSYEEVLAERSAGTSHLQECGQC